MVSEEGPQTDRGVAFAVEVKTGEYAEFERDQRRVAETIANANDEVYSEVVQVVIDDLQASLDVSTRILG